MAERQNQSTDAETGTERAPVRPPPVAATPARKAFWILVAIGIFCAAAFWAKACSQKVNRKLWRSMKHEAHTTISSIRAAEERYRAETSVYLSTTHRSENDFYPAQGAEPKARRFDPAADNQPQWQTLGVTLPGSPCTAGTWSSPDARERPPPWGRGDERCWATPPLGNPGTIFA